MSEVKWIKIVTDIFDDEKMLLIESLPERDGIIVIWFKLLCLAGKQNNNGVFMFNDKIPYTDEMLATIFRRNINTVRLALKTFENYGMIEIINNTITIPKWEKHQSLDALKSAREQTRKRVERYRERQKEIACNVTCNVTDAVTDDVTVTLRNADRIRLEEDKKESKINNADFQSALESEFELLWKAYPNKQGKANALKAYIKARKDKKHPVSFETVKYAVETYAREMRDTETKYIKHGSTWFNQQCWCDYEAKREAEESIRNNPNIDPYSGGRTDF